MANRRGKVESGKTISKKVYQFNSVAQLCSTLCNPTDCSTPGFPVLYWSPGVCSNSCPLSWWCHPTISSSVGPFSSCPQSFPASGCFPKSWLFASGGQSIGASASASVLPMNIQDWFPLEFTGLISAHDYWKNHSFDYTDLCQQSDVTAF